VNGLDPSGQLIGSITDLLNNILIRASVFGVIHGPTIAAGVWAATKITVAALFATISVMILQELGVVPQDEYVAEIGAILGYVLVAELFILSMLPAMWTYGSRPRGMNNPKIRRAVAAGNRFHYDKTTDAGRYEHVGGPTQIKEQRYPQTIFRFARRGQRLPDVEVIGGRHPSNYPGSRWPPGINKGDFKPNTPTGMAFKLPADTLRLPYDPETQELRF